MQVAAGPPGEDDCVRRGGPSTLGIMPGGLRVPLAAMAAAATSSGKFSCRLRRACREKMTVYGADAPAPWASCSAFTVFHAAPFEFGANLPGVEGVARSEVVAGLPQIGR